ncbi:MAG: DUF5711 family protein [Lachnospiraceae bacterium]|nr:DUF5711 family protein [Lachnospiraceae bacterium]
MEDFEQQTSYERPTPKKAKNWKKSTSILRVIQNFINHLSAPVKISGFILILLVIIICIVNIYSANVVYTSYEIEQAVTRDDSKSANYLAYGDGYIRYSDDGIAYYKANGTVVWNHTYEVSNPLVCVSGDYIVVGNITGRNLYVYNRNGLKADIDAAMTVTQVDVAEQGVTAVVLEDGNTNYINMYDKEGTKLSYIITSLTGDGYPLDIAISDDGKKLVVSYISINGEEIKSHLAFYNFSDVGQNKVDRLVGGFDHYGTSVVGEVEFIDNNTVLAIAEDRLSFYSISQYPTLVKEVEVENQIQKFTYSKDYVGLIFNNMETVDKYRMDIYDMRGNKVSDIFFNEEYRKFEFDEDRVLLYNDTLFTLMTVKGKVKYSDAFDVVIEKILPVDGKQRFKIFNSQYIQQIKLN